MYAKCFQHWKHYINLVGERARDIGYFHHFCSIYRYTDKAASMNIWSYLLLDRAIGPSRQCCLLCLAEAVQGVKLDAVLHIAFHFRTLKWRCWGLDLGLYPSPSYVRLQGQRSPEQLEQPAIQSQSSPVSKSLLFSLSRFQAATCWFSHTSSLLSPISWRRDAFSQLWQACHSKEHKEALGNPRLIKSDPLLEEHRCRYLHC